MINSWGGGQEFSFWSKETRMEAIKNCISWKTFPLKSQDKMMLVRLMQWFCLVVPSIDSWTMSIQKWENDACFNGMFFKHCPKSFCCNWEPLESSTWWASQPELANLTCGCVCSQWCPNTSMTHALQTSKTSTLWAHATAWKAHRLALWTIYFVYF